MGGSCSCARSLLDNVDDTFEINLHNKSKRDMSTLHFHFAW